jgi:TfoX/Sxy family transcriptional regulator of competence genes
MAADRNKSAQSKIVQRGAKMATTREFAEFILDQLRDAGQAFVRPMFGEYGLYVNGKIVGFLCDEQLLIKITEAGKSFLGTYETAEAYPGSKPYFLISNPDDRETLGELIRVSLPELPEPKAKKSPVKKKSERGSEG